MAPYDTLLFNPPCFFFNNSIKMYFKNRQRKEERLEPEHSIRFQVLGWIRIFIAGSGFFIKPNMNPKHFPVFNPSADLFYLDFCLMSFFYWRPHF